MITIEDFFNTDYVDSASYDNLRKISSVIDGFKNANRKAIYTIIEKNVKEKTKVSRLGPDIAGYTEYLHGEDGLASVIVNMAQNFVGSNNIALLERNGNFGTRHKPVASASRYIKTRKEVYLTDIFKKEDSKILIGQEFEGSKIEPRFFVPILPMLLINGSEGVSTGFAQKVLPRSPKTIYSELVKVLKGNKKIENINLGNPTWNGFKGDVVKDDEKDTKWYVRGNIEVENTTTINITEVPIYYDLNKYKAELDKLEERGTIESYEDFSEDDNFNFKVKVRRSYSKGKSEKSLIKDLKLEKSVTENYTVINEKNRIQVFDNVEDIFRYYYDIRLNFYEKRKLWLLNNYNEKINLNKSKWIFVKNIVDNKIEINNKTKKQIISQIEKFDKIITINGSYDYLLSMPIYSLSKEKLKEIKDEINRLESIFKTLKDKKLEELWLEDLETIKDII